MGDLDDLPREHHIPINLGQASNSQSGQRLNKYYYPWSTTSTAQKPESTVEFELGDVAYQIDLPTDNAEELRDTLAQYIGHARRASGRIPPTSSTPTTREKEVTSPRIRIVDQVDSAPSA